jgi:hypothetical protein
MRLIRRGVVLGTLALAVSVCASGQVNNPKNIDPSPNPRGSELGPLYASLPGEVGQAHPAVYKLWESLEGKYEGVDQGTHITLTLKRTSPYLLFAETRTETNGRQDVSRGYVQLGDSSPSYISSKVRYALAYRPETLRSSWTCLFYGYAGSDAVSFESEIGDCSFTFGRPVSKVRLDVSPEAIVLSAEKDGKATLTRVSDR